MALAPLLHLAVGTLTGAVLSSHASWTGQPGIRWTLLSLAVVAAGAALAAPGRPRLSLWLLAGLAAAGAQGLAARASHLELAEAVTTRLAIRLDGQVLDGWSRTRWGHQARLRVARSAHDGRPLPLPRRIRIEVRGDAGAAELPPPGARVEALGELRGDADRPLVVVSSRRLLQVTRQAGGLPALRDGLARSLLLAAGTDADRIRGAELAAGLALGRRDLLPPDRRRHWRRSGFAHVLAVSGLHVGIVGGLVWLAALTAGMRATPARLLVLVTLPAYALAAGASPSALRAALMGMAYLLARLLGRPMLPLGAVLLVATGMVLVSPPLVLDAGFQLTVVITAALVRWVPPLAVRLPGPPWLSGAVAVPVIAQVVAAPLVAFHFGVARPGAILANLAVPALLAPLLVTALVATLVAPLHAGLAGPLLGAHQALAQLVLWLGAPGRALELVTPAMPALAVAALLVSGWLALQPGRPGRLGAAGWTVTLLAAACWWALRPAPSPPRVLMLPVADGLAAAVIDSRATVLLDGGRLRHECADLLAAARVGQLDAVVASHGDEDHVGGLVRVLSTTPPARLVLPAWMQSDRSGVPLLRAARRKDVRVVPVARGTVVSVNGLQMEMVWPPGRLPPAESNERSLVARIRLIGGTVLATADIGHGTEGRLVGSTDLACDVLLVPHHGSGGSTGAELLAAARPDMALVPAGPRNTNHHPHPRTLARLAGHGIPYRYPERDGWCAGRPHAGRWRPEP